MLSVEQAGSSRTPVPDVRLLTRYPNQQKDCSVSIRDEGQALIIERVQGIIIWTIFHAGLQWEEPATQTQS